MPKRLSGKQVLDLLFALPSSDSDSDVEPDDGASEELLHLDTADNSGRASPDPGQPQTTSGEQLCDVDSDETVNLQNTDESDQDDGGWGDAVSQFDVQFDDKTPHIRSSLDNRAKEHDYFRLLFCNCRKSC